MTNEIEENVPCYILYRLDDKAAEGYLWMLISWTPDSATTRMKMIYASTVISRQNHNFNNSVFIIHIFQKATLKQQFGSSHLKEEYHATTLEEMTFAGYMRNKTFMAAPTPLTQREEEIKELRRTENKTDIGIDTRHQTMSGIACPITEAAKQAIKDMKRGSYNYLQFSIDLEKEEINISKAENVEVAKLSSQLPTDHASYIIYLFKHSYEGDFLESFVFIYSMPGYTCSVKERMMYSSCKAPFLDAIHLMGIDFSKKLEVDDPSEISEDNLLDELHPKKLLHKTQFAKPAPPTNRGPRRLIK